MMATEDRTTEALEEVLEMMDDIAHRLRRLGNPRIDAYCLAEFEGRNGGWLGKFARDIIEEELESARHPDED
jgi:hypothetical protein